MFQFCAPRPIGEFVCHVDNAINALSSLVERVLFFVEGGEICQAPECETDWPTKPGEGFRTNGSFFHFACYRFRRRFQKYVKRCHPMSVAEVIASYTGRMRKRMEGAAECLARGWRSAYARVRCFPKFEKVTGAKRKVVRNISPRHPVYNLRLARYLKRIEHAVYNIFRKMFNGYHVVFKGMTIFEMGEEIHRIWQKFRKPVAVSVDASKFDRSTKEEALRFEHDFYLQFFEGSEREELEYLLGLQVFNHFTLENNEVRYRVRDISMRCSGDQNTGLGNCILMVSMISAYFDRVGVTPEDYHIVNNGDDAVVIMEQWLLEGFQRDFPAFMARFGYKMVCEDPVYVIEEIEFCSMHPVFDGARWRMVRDPRTATLKDTYCLKNVVNERYANRWLSSVGECGLSLTHGIPIVQNIYEKMIVSSGRLKMGDRRNIGLFRLSRGLKPRSYIEPSDSARLSFWRAFKIAPDAQIDIEHAIKDFRPTYGLRSTLSNWEGVDRLLTPDMGLAA